MILKKGLQDKEMKKIFIIGAGGFGRETAWLIERMNSRKQEPEWDIQGFLDDDVKKQGRIISGYPVPGGCGFLETCREEVWAVCAIGSAAVRRKVADRVGNYKNVRFAVLVDPDAVVSSSVSIGEGSIVCAGAVVTVDISIGRHAIVSMACTIGHDAVLKDFVTLYPGAKVSGSVIAGQGVELGAGSQIIQGKRIGKDTIVGAGAVVIRDLPDGCTAVGVPAEPVRRERHA